MGKRISQPEAPRVEARKLWIAGLSYGEIGKRLKISRQRVQQLVRPPKEIYDVIKKRAKDECEVCGILVKYGHVHHKGKTDDIKDLEYLCRSCHRQAHMNNPSESPLKSDDAPVIVNRRTEIKYRRWLCA